MRNLLRILPTFILLGLVCNPAMLFAEKEKKAQPEVSVKAEIDNAFMTIGDKVNFKVTVIHPKSARVLSINTDEALRDFEVKESRDFSFEEKWNIHEGKNYVLTNYQLGEYVIRPVKIEYELNGKKKTAETNQLYLTIQSVGGEKDQNADIRGIKGVLKLKPLLWPWIILLLIATGGAGFLYWRNYILRKRLMPDIEAPALPAHEEAYQALQRLQLSDLLARGEVKLYFLTLSEIVRRFLERRFQIHALESTTSEIMRALKKPVDPENRKIVQSTLEMCDFVKFAKYQPGPQEVIQTNKTAHEIVDHLKEVPAPVVDHPNQQG